MTSFSDLGLRGALIDALSKSGITEPFAIQEQTIRDSLAGRDVCGKARTGSGKTLAFGLPMLEKIEPGSRRNRPRALVLAPTRELARQIVDALRPLAKPLNLHVAAFYGGAPMDRQVQFLQRGVDIAVCTPGRLIDLTERKSFRFEDIQYVVIDEADHMADMGFLPQVEWIMRQLPHKDGKPTPQTLLFSATLDGDVDVLIRHYMHDPVHHEVVVHDEDKAEVVHRFFEVHNMDRVRVAAAIARGAGRTIAFVRTKRAADRVADQLQEHGVKAAPIHGDLKQSARERALKQFHEGKIEVLVATDVAARGIHVDDIDVVIHYDPPEDHKTYVHRSGRTARAGRTGAVATLLMWDQVMPAEKLKKQLGISDPTVAVFSNDERLADLPNFAPTPEELKATGTDGRQQSGPRPGRPAAAPRRAGANMGGRRGGGRGRGRR